MKHLGSRGPENKKVLNGYLSPMKISLLFPKFMFGNEVFETGDEIIQSLRETHISASFQIIFYDTDKFISNKNYYLEEIINYNPSLFVYLYGPNPDLALSFELLKGVTIRVPGRKVAFFTDSLRLSHSYVMDKLKDSFDAFVCLDAGVQFETYPAHNVGPTPACISQRTFDSLIQPRLAQRRDIDVLVMGTMYKERKLVVEFLREHGINVIAPGGDYGNKRLTAEQYWEISCRAKIRVVTSFTEDRSRQIDPDAPQMKAHITETIASAALLIVDSPHPTSTFFSEGSEFMSYNSFDDLLMIIQRYLNDDEQRQAMVELAHGRFLNQYIGRNFWQNVVERNLDTSRN